MTLWIIGILFTYGFEGKDDDPWWYAIVICLFWPAVLGTSVRKFITHNSQSSGAE